MNTNDNRLKAHKLIDHIFQDLLPAHGMAQRPEQIQLSHRMLDAMQDGRIALCDAGTGIGKTYAYLAAATAASAFPTGQIARPIIISTSSIALQNAVLTEYLPLLSCVLMADGILTKPLKAVIRKGKSHYVCDERLDRRLRQVYPAKKNPEALTALRTLRETLDMDRVSHLSGYDRERVCVPQVCDCKQRDCRYQRFLKTCDKDQFLFQICNHNAAATSRAGSIAGRYPDAVGYLCPPTAADNFHAEPRPSAHTGFYACGGAFCRSRHFSAVGCRSPPPFVQTFLPTRI